MLFKIDEQPYPGLGYHYSLRATEVAKILRSRLPRLFKGIKFSVRCSGGRTGHSSAIGVDYWDGPVWTEVQEIVSGYIGVQYDQSTFDSLGFEKDLLLQHWITPDGVPFLGVNPGSEVDGGNVKEVRNSMPSPGCKLVHINIDSVWVRPNFTIETLDLAVKCAYAWFNDKGVHLREDTIITLIGPDGYARFNVDDKKVRGYSDLWWTIGAKVKEFAVRICNPD